MASARITAKVTLKRIYSYQAPAFGYGYETRCIYTMTAENGEVYVWKTTAGMALKVYNDMGRGHEYDSKVGKWFCWEPINEGDVVRIKATVKGVSEYKGQPQTEVSRVVVLERTFKAETPEERAARLERERKEKEKAQRDSVKGDDFIWRMPYKQYKEHYADCETVAGSFERRENGRATIEVIIRAGRLVPSGVRGESFKGYSFLITENGEQTTATYRAVCGDNAERRCRKDHPAATAIVLDEVYNYGETHRIW